MKFLTCAFLSIFFSISLQSDPKKIYFMELKSNEPKLSESFRRELKEIYSKDKNFELIDEDTIKDLNEKLKKQQMLGCDETRCLQEISNSFGAEEIITGELKVLANQYFLNLKITRRDPDTLEVGIKSSIQKSFFEKQKSYYIKEIALTINNPSHIIDDRSAPPIGGDISYTKSIPFPPIPAPIIPSPLVLQKEVESKMDVLLLYIAKGDTFLKNGNFESAKSNYKLALNYSLTNNLRVGIDLAYRVDLSELLPLYNSFPPEKLSNSRTWTTEETESTLIPKFQNYSQKVKSFNPISNDGKTYYEKIQESAYSSLNLLYAESLNLLYESNRLEEYITRFGILESSLLENKIATSPALNYIQASQERESKRKIGIERDFLPAWNDELRRNCLTIYVSSKVYPYLQIETKESYSSTLEYLRELRKNTKKKLLSGKGAVTPQTESFCKGI